MTIINKLIKLEDILNNKNIQQVYGVPVQVLDQDL